MKTQETNKLVFKTNAIVTLDAAAMDNVIGGATTFVCGDCVVITTRIENVMN